MTVVCLVSSLQCHKAACLGYTLWLKCLGGGRVKAMALQQNIVISVACWNASGAAAFELGVQPRGEGARSAWQPVQLTQSWRRRCSPLRRAPW